MGRRAALSLSLLLVGCAPRAANLLPPSRTLEVTFTQYSALSRNTEIARRTLTPLTFLRVQQALARGGPALRDQPIDLVKEKFVVYLPAGPIPKDGYGLLVYIAPWEDATRPVAWRPPLDRHGLIMVSAANSGNEVKILDRRLPLALLAYENVRAQYPLDPNRIYVGGMSGGARAAETVALAYPDVFRGALLNAGSDPIGGEEGIYLPPADLFHEFQRSRLVYATGEHDEVNLHDDELSRSSMKHWCVFDVEVQRPRKLGHEPLDAISLDRALDALDRPSPIDAARMAECNAGIQRELNAKLADAEAAITRGDRDGASAKLKAIDARYGGLAAPAIVHLREKADL